MTEKGLAAKSLKDAVCSIQRRRTFVYRRFYTAIIKYDEPIIFGEYYKEPS